MNPHSRELYFKKMIFCTIREEIFTHYLNLKKKKIIHLIWFNVLKEIHYTRLEFKINSIVESSKMWR